MEFILFGSFLILLVLNIPIAVALGLSGIIALIFGDMPTPPLLIAQRMFTSLDSFPFMAIPFFMLAGGFMEQGGMSRRLVNFAQALIGSVKGGLGIITIVSCAFFAALSGSNPATVAAIGSIMIPAMIQAGYPLSFAAALAAAGGTLGVVIPPSIPMVTYGVVTNTSIGDLFIAGLIPGLLLALSLIGVVIWKAHTLNLPRGAKSSLANLWKTGRDAFLALMMPIIILGGIYGGIFTPTEAAAVATVYAFIVGVFVFREINLDRTIHIILKASVNTAVVFFVIATSSSFSWLLTSLQVPARVAAAMLEVSRNPFVIILFLNVVLLFLGAILETQAIILLVTPIIFPLAQQLGIHPIVLGILIVVNTSIGMITPPMAVNLFVACSLTGLTIEKISRSILIFLAAELIILLMVSNIPVLSLGLLNLLKGG
ncbi:MAG TPA: TRAP transporter large permease subunit [Spirochaetales bacterium]|nr:TRAP transporter large permease subunit [Spirochaetales bacterium]